MTGRTVIKFQTRFSPLMVRGLYGLASLNAGLVGIAHGGLSYLYASNTLLFIVLVLFGLLLITDAVLAAINTRKTVRFISKLCSVSNRWRHTAFLPIVFAHLGLSLYVLRYYFPVIPLKLNHTYSELSIGAVIFYHVTYSVFGMLLMTLDGVLDNERQKSEK